MTKITNSKQGDAINLNFASFRSLELGICYLFGFWCLCFDACQLVSYNKLNGTIT
jgi:hypothetical protein